jgi:hypothetical protein
VSKLFRSKQTTITFYTANKTAADLFPPQWGSKHLPDWYTAARHKDTEMSVKHCRGLRDYFRTGIAVPLWSDLRMRADNGLFEWQYADQMSELLVEPSFEVLQRKHEALCKIITPWAAECSDTTMFLQSQNMWDPKAQVVRTVNGVFDFKYQHSLNVFFYGPDGLSHTIEAGTTLTMLTPMTTNQIVLRHEYDPEKYLALKQPGGNRAFFNNWYAKYRYRKGKQQ